MRSFLLSALLLIATLPGRADARPQTPPPVQAPPDSLVRTQQTAPESPKSGLQDSLDSWGATLVVDDSTATYTGTPDKPAWITYQGMKLTAGLIIVNTNTNVLTALPLPDSTGTPGTGRIHRPIFEQGNQRIVGDRMDYDLDTERGIVHGGDTDYEAGYYHGDRISAITDDPDYLLVRNAVYTTCDLDHPHYWFGAAKMKIVPDDKVVGRPIVMYIWGVPVLGLPYLVRSIRSGRQSGLLMPKLGTSTLTGSTIRDVGFYWAPSDYFDTRLALDLTSSQGVILRNRSRYNWRYLLSGNVDASYNYDRTRGVTRYETRFNHRQEVSPTLSLVGQGNFSSTNFNQRLSDDPARRLERILRSHLSANKRFASGASLSGTISRIDYLDKGTVDTQFPTLNFRVPRRPLFGSEGASTGGSTWRGGEPGGLRGFVFGPAREIDTTPPAWYENLYIDYSSQLNSSLRTINTPADTALGVAAVDTSISQTGIEQRASLTYSGKMFGWLNVQPNLAMREDWYLGDTARDGFQRRMLWNSSISTSTKLYGVADRPFGVDASFRHVVEPRIGVTYQPDFQDLPEVPTLFGGNPGPQMSLNFSLGQLFQMKRQVGEQEKRTDLARITTTANYNERSRGQKLSDFTTSMVMHPGFINMNLSAVHSFYRPGPANTATNELQWTPTLKSVSYRSAMQLNSGMLMKWAGALLRRPAAAPTAAEEETPPAAEEEELPFGVPTVDAGAYPNVTRPPRRGSGNLWSLSLSHDLGWTRGSTEKRQSLDGSLTFNIPKWTVTWAARYDVTRRQMVRQSFSIYRDLHCWEARLQINPTGPGRGFWFVINIKEIPELKYEQRRTYYR